MAAVTREQILTALFNLLRTSASFVTASRHFKLWADVPAANRPALFVKQMKPAPYEGSRDGVPPIRRLMVSAFVYVSTDQSDPTPDKQLNDILDAFDSVMAPSPVTNRQTLGNLVWNAKINGDVFIDDGALDNDGLLVVPIEIILP